MGERRFLSLAGPGLVVMGGILLEAQRARVGGWGHIIGDKGSGYEIGLRGIKAAVYYLDRDGRWTDLGRNILQALQLNEPEELIDWAKTAGKTEIAALAVQVSCGGGAGYNCGGYFGGGGGIVGE